MGRFVKPIVVLATFVAALNPAQAQQGRARVDVQHYVIDAEINPETQSCGGDGAGQLCPPGCNFVGFV